MSVVYTRIGCIQAAFAITLAGLSGATIGLFKNNVVPTRDTTLADLTPANFSGYAGLLPLVGWIPPTWDGAGARSAASAVSWSHDGGLVANSVYGYYVIDALSNMVLLELYPSGPVIMAASGDTFQVVPILSFSSRF